MRLITVSGLDGSGKSTQTQLLKEHLESQGQRVFYFHAVQSGIAQKLREFKNKHCLICKLTGKCESDSKEKSVTTANWFQIKLRKFALAVDIRRFKKLHKKLEKEGCDYILSDRYFYDSLVNIEYLKKTLRHSLGHEMSKLTIEIPKPDVAIYLDADPDAIMRRERQPNQGLEYLKKKKELYDRAAEKFGLSRIDGNREKEKIFEEIKSRQKIHGGK